MTNYMRFATIALAGSALFSVSAHAEDSPIVGQWALTMETPVGAMEATMTVAKEDEGYTIEIVDDPAGDATGGGEVTDIEVDGTDFSFKRDMVLPEFTIPLDYSGSIEGDMLTGKAGSSFGDSPITGTRLEQ